MKSLLLFLLLALALTGCAWPGIDNRHRHHYPPPDPDAFPINEKGQAQTPTENQGLKQ